VPILRTPHLPKRCAERSRALSLPLPHARPASSHEKSLPTPWIVARLTAPGSRVAADEVALPVAFGIVDLGDPIEPRSKFATRVATARAVLRCPDIAGLTRSYTGSVSRR